MGRVLTPPGVDRADQFFTRILARLSALERRGNERLVRSDPVGLIAFLGLPTVPEGWIVLDGTTVGPDYPVLRQALVDAGSPHGFSSGNPHRPNLINRVLIGSGGTYALGSSGGNETMTTALMPSHTHIQNAHNHTFLRVNGITQMYLAHGVDSATGTGKFQIQNTPGSTLDVNNATATNQNTGSGGTGNNLPPYVGALPIMRAY